MQAADTVLQANIDAEAAARRPMHGTLGQYDAEACGSRGGRYDVADQHRASGEARGTTLTHDGAAQDCCGSTLHRIDAEAAARAAADTALQGGIDTAQGTADQAIADAAAAQGTADAAQTTADQAILDAATAQGTADSALTTAQAADTKADQAITDSSTALSTAQAADAKADTALSTAQAVDAKADDALATADNALTIAQEADAKADTALSTAQAVDAKATDALNTADAADAKADEAIAGVETINESLFGTSIELGQGSAASENAVAIGVNQTANGSGAVAIGDPNVATGTGAVAIGADNVATGDGAVAIGNLSSAVGQGSVAIGNAANAGTNGVAVGNGASTGGFANSVAVGAGSVNTADNQVNVGGRTISGVAAGAVNATSTDAVNGSQLHATNQAIAGFNANLSRDAGRHLHAVRPARRRPEGHEAGHCQCDRHGKCADTVHSRRRELRRQRGNVPRRICRRRVDQLSAQYRKSDRDFGGIFLCRKQE